MQYVLIDYENIQPDNVDQVDSNASVVAFLGRNQTKISLSFAASLQNRGAKGRYVKCDGRGRNALDFMIAYEIGRLSKENEAHSFFIVSKDKGFDTLINVLRTEKKRDICRVESLGLLGEDPKKKCNGHKDDAFCLIKALKNKPKTRKAMLNLLATRLNKRPNDKKITAMYKQLLEGGAIREDKGKLAWLI